MRKISIKDIDRIWVTSDLHFGHKNILSFSPKRMAASNGDIDLHDSLIVEELNKLEENSILLCLGDLTMSTEKLIKYSALLKIKNRFLVRGNHDNFDEAVYKKAGWQVIPTFAIGHVCFSHYPIHPCELIGGGSSWGHYIANVHGHIHQNIIDDIRYHNVCLENCEMKPVKLAVLLNNIKAPHRV